VNIELILSHVTEVFTTHSLSQTNSIELLFKYGVESECNVDTLLSVISTNHSLTQTKTVLRIHVLVSIHTMESTRDLMWSKNTTPPTLDIF
jgi:hypothetical protein